MQVTLDYFTNREYKLFSLIKPIVIREQYLSNCTLFGWTEGLRGDEADAFMRSIVHGSWTNVRKG